LDRGSSCGCFQPWQHLLQLMLSASSCNPANARTRCRPAQMSCESEPVINEHNNHGSKIRPVAKPLQGSFRLRIIWASSIYIFNTKFLTRNYMSSPLFLKSSISHAKSFTVRTSVCSCVHACVLSVCLRLWLCVSLPVSLRGQSLLVYFVVLSTRGLVTIWNLGGLL
jgi:hypothetical protein